MLVVLFIILLLLILQTYAAFTWFLHDLFLVFVLPLFLLSFPPPPYPSSLPSPYDTFLLIIPFLSPLPPPHLPLQDQGQDQGVCP